MVWSNLQWHCFVGLFILKRYFDDTKIKNETYHVTLEVLGWSNYTMLIDELYVIIQ